MPKIIDPLAAFMSGHVQQQDRWPVPLAETAFDVTIEAGLAVVETKRLFRNVEKHAIEAALTFPVPIHAVFFHLEAEIDGRLLLANVKAKAQAREDYEGAIEQGKSAALHEELLPGIHLLSLANIKPGGEISLTTKWVMPLMFDGTLGHLRIPLTVGEIYGRSGLSDADELIIGGKLQKARLTVRAGSALITLGRGSQGRHLQPGTDGAVEVAMDRPIDLSISAWPARSLRGTMKSGAGVLLQLSPAASENSALTASILVDKSGSMGGHCASGRSLTMHEATLNALAKLADTLHDQDVIELWEFDGSPSLVGTAYSGPDGTTSAVRFKNLLNSLSTPDGGTRIGKAILAAAQHSEAQDLVVLTDGKSFDLDVDQLAKLGRRISAIFIGEDSLEARLGSLVAETGGQIFIASGEDVNQQVLAAMSALRGARDQRAAVSWPAEKVDLVRNNLLIEAQFGSGSKGETSFQLIDPCAVAAAAIGFVLPITPPEMAGQLAEQEGILTRRTSLILVDEAGESQKGLPAFRKISLARTSVGVTSGGSGFERESRRFNEISFASTNIATPRRRHLTNKLTPTNRGLAASRLFDWVSRWFGRTTLSELRDILHNDIRKLASEPGFDWAGHAPQLASGDASCLPPFTQVIIASIAEKRPIQDLAIRLAMDKPTVVIFLAALSISRTDHHAKRIAQHLLGDWRHRLPKPTVTLIVDALDL
ncbi:vWFA domain containing protein [Sphingomonadaceae bacterium]